MIITPPRKCFNWFAVALFSIGFTYLIGGLVLVALGGAERSLSFTMMSGIWCAVGVLAGTIGRYLDWFHRRLEQMEALGLNTEAPNHPHHSTGNAEDER